MQSWSAAEGVDRSDGDTARLKTSSSTSFLCFSVAQPLAVGVPADRSGPQGSRLGTPDDVAFRDDTSSLWPTDVEGATC